MTSTPTCLLCLILLVMHTGIQAQDTAPPRRFEDKAAKILLAAGEAINAHEAVLLTMQYSVDGLQEGGSEEDSR